MLPLVLTRKSGGNAIKAMSGRPPLITEAKGGDAHTVRGKLYVKTTASRPSTQRWPKNGTHLKMASCPHGMLPQVLTRKPGGYAIKAMSGRLLLVTGIMEQAVLIVTQQPLNWN